MKLNDKANRFRDGVVTSLLILVLVSIFVGILTYGYQVKYKNYLVNHERLEVEVLYEIDGYEIDDDNYWAFTINEINGRYRTKTFTIVNAEEESLEVGYYVLLEKREPLNYVAFLLNAYSAHDKYYKVTVLIAI